MTDAVIHREAATRRAELKKACRDCIHSTLSSLPECHHPQNNTFRLCQSQRGFSGEEERRTPHICGKSGRWFATQ